jgi:hypothetical protein
MICYHFWNVVQEIAANFQSTSTVVFYRNEFQEDFIVDLKKEEYDFQYPKCEHEKANVEIVWGWLCVVMTANY